jgi:hypothetical protein
VELWRKAVQAETHYKKQLIVWRPGEQLFRLRSVKKTADSVEL